VNIELTYNGIVEWMSHHVMGAVVSTYHQMMKFPIDHGLVEHEVTKNISEPITWYPPGIPQ